MQMDVEVSTGSPNPPHAATDAGKLAALIASMEEDGWIGAPVVVDGREGPGGQALTGSHRIKAAARTWTRVPCVEVRDLCAVHGLDWDALLAEHGDWYEAGIALVDLLPADVVTELGLDLH